MMYTRRKTPFRRTGWHGACPYISRLAIGYMRIIIKENSPTFHSPYRFFRRDFPRKEFRRFVFRTHYTVTLGSVTYYISVCLSSMDATSTGGK